MYDDVGGGVLLGGVKCCMCIFVPESASAETNKKKSQKCQTEKEEGVKIEAVKEVKNQGIA